MEARPDKLSSGSESQLLSLFTPYENSYQRAVSRGTSPSDVGHKLRMKEGMKAIV
jgi:hypothetical protein